MLLRPSKARPFAKEESPITAITSYFSLFKSRAKAKPIAALIDVEE